MRSSPSGQSPLPAAAAPDDEDAAAGAGRFLPASAVAGCSAFRFPVAAEDEAAGAAEALAVETAAPFRAGISFATSAAADALPVRPLAGVTWLEADALAAAAAATGTGVAAGAGAPTGAEAAAGAAIAAGAGAASPGAARGSAASEGWPASRTSSSPSAQASSNGTAVTCTPAAAKPNCLGVFSRSSSSWPSSSRPTTSWGMLKVSAHCLRTSRSGWPKASRPFQLYNRLSTSTACTSM
mmetsp:Transcript_31047/g.89515  ORF Transcript_31047/g.89515 Transcript_31047/m.89515 type:complete len:239 (+) Transcript_31047:203-919(+)